MRKIAIVLKNWRYWILYIAGTLAALGIFCECESLSLFIIIKAVAFALIALVAKLGRIWRDRGVIPELVDYINR